MPFLPIITNNLGKIAATMAAGTLGYASRKTIGRWLAGEDEQPETQACMRQKAQEVRQLQGQMTMTELDRKHSELLEKLNQANTAALGEMRTLTKEVKTGWPTCARAFRASWTPSAQRRCASARS